MHWARILSPTELRPSTKWPAAELASLIGHSAPRLMAQIILFQPKIPQARRVKLSCSWRSNILLAIHEKIKRHLRDCYTHVALYIQTPNFDLISKFRPVIVDASSTQATEKTSGKQQMLSGHAYSPGRTKRRKDHGSDHRAPE